MRTFTTANLTRLLGQHQAPCISIFMPSFRSYPDSQQNPIRYKNLVSEAESSLRQAYPGSEVRGLLAKFRELEADEYFWTHQLDGLALFGNAELFEVWSFPRAMPERIVVADSFHVKPLIRFTQSADRYQVLCIQREECRLFEGNRDALESLEHEDVPLHVTEALGMGVGLNGVPTATSPAKQAQAADTSTPPPSLRSDGRGGQAAKGDDANLDAERFFRAVDRAVWDHFSRPSGLPLLPVGTTDNLTLFRSVAKNQQLLDSAIEKSPSSFDEKGLQSAAWDCVKNEYLTRLKGIADDFAVAKSRDQGSDQVTAVAEAAVKSRVGRLLVDAGKVIPGTIDPTNGKVRMSNLDCPNTDDVLDDIAETVLRNGGEVVVVPSEQMPTQSGLAAVFRY